MIDGTMEDLGGKRELGVRGTRSSSLKEEKFKGSLEFFYQNHRIKQSEFLKFEIDISFKSYNNFS